MTTAPLRRPPGRPRLIDRRRIVEAAMRLDVDTLTLRAVADELGVNRKALSYHVADRDELLRLLAAEALGAALDKSPFPDHDDWRVMCKNYAVELRNSVITTGTLALHVTLGTPTDLEALRPAERVLRSLTGSGFDDHTALAAATLLSALALDSGRSAVRSARTTSNPQTDEIGRALQQFETEKFPVLKRLTVGRAALGPDEQFHFDIDTCIAGLEHRRRT